MKHNKSTSFMKIEYTENKSFSFIKFECTEAGLG